MEVSGLGLFKTPHRKIYFPWIEQFKIDGAGFNNTIPIEFHLMSHLEVGLKIDLRILETPPPCECGAACRVRRRSFIKQQENIRNETIISILWQGIIYR